MKSTITKIKTKPTNRMLSKTIVISNTAKIKTKPTNRMLSKTILIERQQYCSTTGCSTTVDGELKLLNIIVHYQININISN